MVFLFIVLPLVCVDGISNMDIGEELFVELVDLLFVEMIGKDGII